MTTGSKADRVITLGPNCASIPEKLLLAHARGRVLFITGAGTSAAAGLPNFRDLVVQTYETIDAAAYDVLSRIPDNGDLTGINTAALDSKQRAEVNQFCRANYDIVLGMLERRIDGAGTGASSIRERIAGRLRGETGTPAAIHKALIKLSNRGSAHSIATTNFDLLLEAAAKRHRIQAQPYSLGAIPRPSLSRSFAGILHIHGALDPNGARTFDFIVTDEDFGEFYMRRRIVPDFVYDAARLYNIVLVGYPRAARRLAHQMTMRVSDTRLDRETRNGLIFAIVVEAMRHLIDDHAPASFLSSAQQAIRVVEPEVRAHAAHAVSRVQKDWPDGKDPLGTAEDVYRRAISPFMMRVWPQERSLTSAGTASEFADIPAAAKGEFSDAVRVLSRFLVPFDCWSMSDYGLHDHSDDSDPLELIDDAEKAAALVDLLDLTIGTADGAVVPYGLGKALQHVRNVAPRVAESPRFRRLAAAARQ